MITITKEELKKLQEQGFVYLLRGNDSELLRVDELKKPPVKNNKELTLKIKRMSEERLKTLDNGKWSEAYLVSDDDFKTTYSCKPIVHISELIRTFKIKNKEL